MDDGWQGLRAFGNVPFDPDQPEQSLQVLSDLDQFAQGKQNGRTGI